MVEHLGGHAALIVKDQRYAAKLAHGPAKQRAFVEMGVNYVGLELGCDALHRGGQRHIEIELMARGTNHHAPFPRDVYRAADINAGHIIADMVGAKGDGMTPALEMGYLL